MVERADPTAQDGFREDAHTLLAAVLDKNNEADARRVRMPCIPRVKLLKADRM